MNGSGSVAWETLCKSKKEGGLGLLDIKEWNLAAIMKRVWAVANKKDNLWIKWIHCVYVKQEDWWSYKAPSNCSWYWKKVVEAKEKVKILADCDQFTKGEYKIADGYKMLTPQQQQVHWCKELKQWLNWHAKSSCVQGLLRWIGRSKMSSFKKQVYASSLAALVHRIWLARNDKMWNQQDVSVHQICQQVSWQVKTRISCVKPKKMKQGADWWQYSANTNDSWYWRKLVALKGKVMELFDENERQKCCTQYNVSLGYTKLKLAGVKKQWTSVVWSRLNCPKHSFILWLSMLQRLKTKNRMKVYRPEIDSCCHLCSSNEEESVDHLFFACSFSRECFDLVKN
ncbi:hypothetical protein CsatB_001702 [Cannabis sativa]